MAKSKFLFSISLLSQSYILRMRIRGRYEVLYVILTYTYRRGRFEVLYVILTYTYMFTSPEFLELKKAQRSHN